MLVWLHAEQDWRISVIDDIKEAFEIATDGQKRLIFFNDFLEHAGHPRTWFVALTSGFRHFYIRSEPKRIYVLSLPPEITSFARLRPTLDG